MGLLEFDNGLLATVQATTAAVPGQAPAVEVLGDRGTASVSGSWGHLEFRLRSSAAGTDMPAEVAAMDSDAQRTHLSVEPYAEQIKDFVAAVRDGRLPLVDGGEARKALVIVDALYRSAGRGRWVDVES